jgi:hypothetical protein
MALKAVSAPLGSPVGGSGTTGTIPVWSSGTTLGDSPLTVSGSNVTGAGAIRATGTSAAAPAFTGSDTDTGMYFPAANQVRFSTAGALAIAIDASQNVGIGTASPSAKLEVPFTGSLAGMRIQIGSANYFNATNHFFRTLGDNNLVQISGNYIDASLQANYGLRLPATPGNGDRQTLDSYQELDKGVASYDWTPTVTFGTGGTVTYTVDQSSATRIGRMVFFFAQISYTVTAAPTGGDLSFTLPATGAGFNQTVGVGNANATAAGDAGPFFMVLGSSATSALVRTRSGTAANQLAARLTTSSTFTVSGAYQV